MYRLRYHPRTAKFLKRIPQWEVSKILEKVSQLTSDPITPKLDVKKLTSTQGSYRLRIGNIRVIYEVDSEERQIYIHDIGWRGNIY